MSGVPVVTSVPYVTSSNLPANLEPKRRPDLIGNFQNTQPQASTRCVVPSEANVTSLEAGKIVGIVPGGGEPREVNASDIVGFVQRGYGQNDTQTELLVKGIDGKPEQFVLYMAPLSAVVDAYAKATK